MPDPCPHEATIAALREALAASQRRERTWRRVAELIHHANQPEESPMTVQPPAPPYLGPVAHSSGNGNKPINRIVIHCTVSACAVGARDIAAYFRKPTAGGSAHYITSATETIQSAYDSVVTWHAPPNAHSLGVEMCCTLSNKGKGHWEQADHVAMLKRTAELVAQLCLAYGVPIKRLSSSEVRDGKHGICGHVNVSEAFGQSSHWDPGPFFPWAKFMGMVEAAAADLIRPAVPKPAKKVPSKRPARTLRVGTYNVERDRPKATVLAELTRLTRDLDVLTLQECNGYADVLTQVPGFTRVAFYDAPEQGESPILVRNGLAIHYARAEQVTTTGWRTVRGGRTKPKWATFARVEGCGFLSVHTPPTVQTLAKRLAAPARWKAYQELLASIQRLSAKMPRPLVVAGDFNVDARTDDGKLAMFPRSALAQVGLARALPPGGTHGNRVIDMFATKGATVTETRALAGYGSDHRPVVGLITY